MSENKKKSSIWYGLMRFVLAITAGLFIGGVALGTTQAHASSGQVQVESTAAGTETQQEDDGGTMMLMLMMGGLLVLILFVVVVVVSTATSTAGLAGGDEI